ncbi:MAG: hypothetical protein GY906_38385, partial [bacterium]|nr:hypothetical protein [bacterium]
VDYAYDRFGRALQDGDLTYAYDDNGNRVEIGYPGDVRALYTYDFADRQATLDVEQPGEPLQAIVTASSYEPSGPLASLTLGNGLVETHTFDSRHHPDRITVAGGSTLLDWQYSTDDEGNVTAITDLLDPANNRVFGYHDVQYFLIQGDGPWGNRGWTYDKIGNRLTETRDGQTDTYVYLPNLAGGNSAQLAEIQLGAGGTRTYAYDAAGNQTQVVDQGDVIDWTYDDASRLSRIERPSAPATTVFLYDGRSFLRSSTGRAPITEGDPLFCDGFESGDLSNWIVEESGRGPAVCLATAETGPVYSSEGVLHSLLKTAVLASGHVLYFDGRPVAILEPNTVLPQLAYLSVDHLGTPLLASDVVAANLWEGGLGPFGEDHNGAQSAGIFLRFLGQWEDATWKDSSSGSKLHYNLHRSYSSRQGRYTKADPIGLRTSFNLYTYTSSNPILFVDPDGLRTIAFTGCDVWFLDDDLRVVKRCRAGSGRKGTQFTDQEAPFRGPIPQGEYFINPREFTGGFLRDLVRGPGWGRWRAPIHPKASTNTRGRSGFFLHGDDRLDFQTAGCIDIGDCDTWARDWAMEEADRRIDVVVNYETGTLCN